MVIISISWYNSIVKRGDNKKQDIKKILLPSAAKRLEVRSSKKAYIYNIEENGGKPQKYIYVLIITYGAKIKI